MSTCPRGIVTILIPTQRKLPKTSATNFNHEDRLGQFLLNPFQGTFVMCFPSFKAPELPPPPPPPPELPSEASEPVKRAREEERKRAAALQGDKATLLTGAQGLTAPATTGKVSLLGQGG